MANLEGLGVIGRGKTVSALPFGKVAPSGVNVEIGNKDIINGFGLGKFFNPSAQIVKQLDWFDHTIGRYRQSHSNIFNP